MSTPPACSSLITQATCAANPNSAWNSTENVCVCCPTDGTQYINTTGTTPVCTSCPSGTQCGSNGGYCNGTTGNSSVICTQNTATGQWAYTCPTGTCGGLCGPGSCGIKEWLMFSQCSKNGTTGFYSCTFSITQWKSILVYVGLIILLLILAFVLIKALGPKSSKISPLPSTTRPLGYPPIG